MSWTYAKVAASMPGRPVFAHPLEVQSAYLLLVEHLVLITWRARGGWAGCKDGMGEGRTKQPGTRGRATEVLEGAAAREPSNEQNKGDSASDVGEQLLERHPEVVGGKRLWGCRSRVYRELPLI